MATTKALLPLILILFFAHTVTAQTPKIPYGSKVYIAPMEEGFDGFIKAEIMKRKLPVVLVVEDKEAEYIITGGAAKAEGKWYDALGGNQRNRNEGNIQLVSAKDKTIIWAGEAGDRSMWWGAVKKGGKRKVADRLVGKMNSALFKKD